MGSLLAKLISFLLSRLFNHTPPLSQEAQQADRAAVAETKLSQQVQANADVAKAVAASRSSDARLERDPDSLRAPSPDSRD